MKAPKPQLPPDYRAPLFLPRMGGLTSPSGDHLETKLGTVLTPLQWAVAQPFVLLRNRGHQ